MSGVKGERLITQCHIDNSKRKSKCQINFTDTSQMYNESQKSEASDIQTLAAPCSTTCTTKTVSVSSLWAIHCRNNPWRCQASVKQGHCVTGSHVTEMQWRSLACQCRWSGNQGGEMVEGAKRERRKRKRRIWRVSVKNQTWTQGKWKGGCWLLTRYTVKKIYVCQRIAIFVSLYEKKMHN